MRRHYFICILIGLLPFQSFSQQELTLFFAKKNIAANKVNPARFKNDHIVFSLPALSFNYGNSAFSFNDVFKEEGDVTKADVEGVLSRLKDENIIQIQASAEIFSVQFRVKKVYLTLSAAEKLNTKLSYSDQLISLAWNGNAQFVGREANIGPAFDLSVYKEIGLGAVYETGKFTWGTRLRFLSGIANISTERNTAVLYTSNEIYQARFRTDYEVNTAGIENSSGKDFSPFGKWKNPGMAIDLGTVFRPDDKWELSASVLDLGSIKWKNDVKSYISSGEISFDGLYLNKYFEVDTFNFDQYVDSLEEEFDPEISHKAYRQRLTPVVYMGVSRKIGSKQEVGLAGYGEFFEGFKPGYLLYYGYSPAEKTELGLSLNIKNKVFNHVGLSLCQQIGRVQLYFVSDDIINLIRPYDARNINFRFGINVYIGSGSKEATSSKPTPQN